jgi:hypothetical protein
MNFLVDTLKITSIDKPEKKILLNWYTSAFQEGKEKKQIYFRINNYLNHFKLISDELIDSEPLLKKKKIDNQLDISIGSLGSINSYGSLENIIEENKQGASFGSIRSNQSISLTINLNSPTNENENPLTILINTTPTKNKKEESLLTKLMISPLAKNLEESPLTKWMISPPAKNLEESPLTTLFNSIEPIRESQQDYKIRIMSKVNELVETNIKRIRKLNNEI